MSWTLFLTIIGQFIITFIVVFTVFVIIRATVTTIQKNRQLGKEDEKTN